MADGDQQPPYHQPLHTDSRFLLAAFATALLIAGSAFFSGSHLISSRKRVASSKLAQPALKATTLAPPSLEPHTDPEAKHPKSSATLAASRSKERRRRGKDPVKDLFKGSKKIRPLSTLPPSDDDRRSLSPPKASSSSLRHPMEERSQRPGERSPRDASLASTSSIRTSPSSSRSHSVISSVAADDTTTSTTPVEAQHPTPDSQISDLPPTTSISTTTSNSVPASVHPEITPASSGTGTNSDTTPPIHDKPFEVITNGKAKQKSTPKSTSASRSGSKLPSDAADPWNWDGQGSATADPTVVPEAPSSPYRKPPRFQATSGASPSKRSSAIVEEKSPTGNGDAHASSSKDSETPPSTPSTSTATRPPLSTNPSSAMTARRTSTPRRAPTPSSSSQAGGTSTPPPSLSIQTQLASMKGALEAARLREDKMKGDLEAARKELDSTRWEYERLRRREGEMHAQIHYLQQHMHMLMAQQASANGQQQQSPTAASTPPNSNPNPLPPSNATPNTTTTAAPQPPPHLTLPPPFQFQIMQQMNPMSPNGILSPPLFPLMTPMHLTMPVMSPSGPHPPYFPYPPPPPQMGTPGVHGHQYMSPTIAQQQQGVFSMMYNNAPGSPSVAESSAGNSSATTARSEVELPDVNGSGSPNRGSYPRGRKRTRTRLHDGWEEGTNVVMGGVEWENGHGGGPYVHDDHDEGEANGNANGFSDGDESGSEVNELVYEAIFKNKRPESIRLNSSSSTSSISRKSGARVGGIVRAFQQDLDAEEGGIEEQQQNGREEDALVDENTEFTFPSLSDLGNVRTGKRVVVEHVREPTPPPAATPPPPPPLHEEPETDLETSHLAKQLDEEETTPSDIFKRSATPENHPAVHMVDRIENEEIQSS